MSVPGGHQAVLEETHPHTSNPYREIILTERQGARYMRSDAWKERRKAAIKRADHRCQVCNSPHELQVHHRTYDRWGHEEPGDLTVLCRTCHCLFHAGGRILGLYVEEEDVVL